MSSAYPEIWRRAPHDGPRARGHLLALEGANGSQQFMVCAGF
jgi:hypothetical protein